MAQRAATVEPKHAYSASVHERTRKSGVVHDVMFRMNGKQMSRSFTSRPVAEKWANLLRVHGPFAALEELEGAAKLNTAQRRTFDDYARLYIDSRSSVEEKTVEDYEMFLRTGVAAAFGARNIAHITDNDLAAWVNAEIELGRAAKTIRNRFGFVAAVFNYAVTKGAVTTSPCRGVRLPQYARKAPVFLLPKELGQILRYLPESEREVALFMASTGLRWGEVTALGPNDVDLSRKVVTVSKAWKHSAKSGWKLGTPKSARSNRTVPLSDELIPMLRRRVVERKEFIFSNRRGGPLRQQRFYEGYWKPAVRMANGLRAFDLSKRGPETGWVARTGQWWDQPPAEVPLAKFPRVHDLRHTHASWLIADGVPLTVVQYRLGHESIKTTSDTYGHLEEEHRRMAADATSKMIQGVMAELTDAP